MNHMNKTAVSLKWILPVIILGLTACGPKAGSESVGSIASAGPEETPTASFLLANAPSVAPGLNTALEAGSPGDVFYASGRVGGLLEPLSADFAAFVIADESLQFCDEMEGDGHCATPWDACCEDPDRIAASRAFVQFVDSAGNPVEASLRAAIGLAENDFVIVKGKLSPDSAPGNRIILAEGIAIIR
jgi:hypothetical protein